MGWRSFIGLVFLFLVSVILLVYYFVPFNAPLEFSESPPSSNFSIMSGSLEQMQFYSNMRYVESSISYKIYEECSLQKKSDMERALDILSEKTILSFYSVDYGEEISITCSDIQKYEGNAFVGGEGGVTNVTIAGNFHVIHNGKVLLIRDSKCPNPNIAIHELLHSLGFDHSENQNNIMYETTNCDQTIGEDIPVLINQIYSISPKPDLVFENTSMTMNGKYLDAIFSLRNNGLKYSPPAKIVIYVDDKNIKELDLDSLDIGYGTKLTLSNLWIKQINVGRIDFVIETDFEELDKNNNKVSFNLNDS